MVHGGRREDETKRKRERRIFGVNRGDTCKVAAVMQNK
jgi:hypothetical protein